MTLYVSRAGAMAICDRRTCRSAEGVRVKDNDDRFSAGLLNLGIWAERLHAFF